MALDTIPKQEGGKLKAVASGTLPSGKPVVVNADGTVSVVAETAVSDSAGSPVVFENGGSAIYTSAAYDVNAGKIVIAYQDEGNSQYGTAIVGTVSGTSISFGTAVVFESAVAAFIKTAYDANSQKVVITYQDDGNSGSGTAIVGTVSGTSISFGTAVVYNSGSTTQIGITYDANAQKIVITYRDTPNSGYGTAVVGTVSGTSISFGSEVVFESASTAYTAITYDANAQKVVIAYKDLGNSNYGTAIVGTVSGTSISFGTAVVFESAKSDRNAIAYDASSQKVVIAYQDDGNSDYGTAIVGTVSGTSISFGSAVVFESADTRDISISYDESAQKVVIAYKDGGNTSAGTFITGAVSGTSISFGSPVVFESDNTDHTGSAYDSNNKKVVISYRDNGNSQYGTAVVVQAAGSVPNLTSENYIGMSGGVVAVAESSIGATSVVNTGSNLFPTIAYDTNSNRVVIAYGDSTNYYGKAVVGTVSGGGVSFGTPVVFNSATTTSIQPNHSIAFDSNSNKVVIVYKDNGNSNQGTAIVGNVDPSNNSISFGSETVFETGHTTHPVVAFDSSNNKVLISFKDYDDSQRGKAIVGTISGTSISFGSVAQFSSNSTTSLSTVFDSSSNKIIIAYKDVTASNAGKAVVATISGTSVSFGTAVQFDAYADYISASFDSDTNKVILSYFLDADTDSGEAVVGTVSGTAISFGTPVTFASVQAVRISSTYDTLAKKTVVFYRDGTNSDLGKVVELETSGTSVTVSAVKQFSATTTSSTSSVYDPDNLKTVTSYIDEGNSTDLETVLFTGTTITRGQVASGGNATVDIVGTVSTNQLSLTAGQQYFVQTDGTLGLTAASPSVLAGTAISATKLVVKT